MKELINLSFLTGLFPKILKQAKIIPIRKKETSRTATAIDLSHSYQILAKLFKNWFIGSSANFVNLKQLSVYQ